MQTNLRCKEEASSEAAESQRLRKCLEERGRDFRFLGRLSDWPSEQKLSGIQSRFHKGCNRLFLCNTSGTVNPIYICIYRKKKKDNERERERELISGHCGIRHQARR